MHYVYILCIMEKYYGNCVWVLSVDVVPGAVIESNLGYHIVKMELREAGRGGNGG